MKRILYTQLWLMIAISFTSLAFVNYQQPTWDVPDEYINMKNAVKKTNEVLVEGKQLYNLHCASCHGITGKGDGKKSEHLAKIPANLTLNASGTGRDGEFFYKIKIGRNGLHSYKNKLDDQQIWTIMHHMNTFR